MPQTFQFDPYDNRAATGSIADIMLRTGQVQANALRNSGESRARTAAMVGQAGAAVAGSIGDIMQERKTQREQQAIAGVLKAAAQPDGTYDPAKVRDALPAQLAHHLEPLLAFVDKQNQTVLTTQKARQDLSKVTERDPTKDLVNAAGDVITPGTPKADPFTLGPGAVRFAADGTEIARGPDNPAVAETARHNQAMEGIAKMTAGRQAAEQAETARHNRTMEGLTAQKNSQAAADVTELTPAGLDAAALNYAKTGQLPPLGMGDKTTRKQIINRAAQMMPGLDIASARADYDANKQTLTALQKQRSSIGAFEQTAQKNIDLFLETAGKVVDTGSPLANGLVRAVSGKVLGSPDQASYDAARQVAINEIAKVTQGGGLSGVLSDSARHEIAAFNPANATLKQTVAVLRLLKRDMDNRIGPIDEQIAGIQSRLKTAQTPAPAAGTIRARDTNGKLHEAAAGTELPKGWVLEP